MAKRNVIRGGQKILGTLGSGIGDPLLTRDTTTKEVGEVNSAGGSGLTTTLLNGQILIGNAINLATANPVSGAVMLSNTGVTSIANDVITNVNIFSGAGITYGKLNLANSIVNNDIADLANITRTKLATGIAHRVIINDGLGNLAEAAEITADRVLLSDANGIPIASTVTTATFDYYDPTSSIQTQLDNRLTFSSGITPAVGDLLQFTGGSWVNFPIGTVGQVLSSNGTDLNWTAGTSNGIPIGGTTGQYLDKIDATNYNVQWSTLNLSKITDVTSTAAQVNILATGFYDATSSVQSQINTKLGNDLAYNALFIGNISNTAGQLSPGANGEVLMIVAGVPTWEIFTPGTGSVTSINVAGGTTGLSFTGGPITTTGTITAGGILIAANGGTGQSAYTIGDLLYASSTTALSKLPIGTAGQILSVTAGVPTWASGVAVTDGDKGDITVTTTGTVWTIDNDVVTFAKLQNITQARLLGRYTASTGDAQEITLGSGLTLNAGTGVLDAVISSGTTVKKENFAADGIISIFTVVGGTVDQLLLVFVGGQQHIEGVNFTVSGQDINFGTPPPSGSIITVTYFESLVMGGGGGGDTFASDVTLVLPDSTYSIGKYKNGETAPWNGLTAVQALLDAAIDYINPVFTSFSISGQATTVEVGTTLSGSKTFTWGVNDNSGIVTTIDLYNNTTASTLLAGTPDDGTQAQVITTIQLNSSGATQSWKGIANNTSPAGTINSSNFTVTGRYLTFYGSTATTPVDSATVRALPSSVFYTGGGSITLPTGTTLAKFAFNIISTSTITSVIDTTALGANITADYVLTGTLNVLDAGGTIRVFNSYLMTIGAPYAVSHDHVITFS